MPTRLVGGACFITCLLVAQSAGAQAAATTSAAFPKARYTDLNTLPDWGGIWTLDMSSFASIMGSQPALKGTYRQAYEAWQREVREKQGEVQQTASHCRPPGMPVIMMAPQYPMEFLFTPGRVTTHHEAWMQWRVIYTDGRKHPDDLDPTFNGHSIGHWEGETLVVDTVGIKTSVEFNMGMKHSDRIHIVERMQLSKEIPDTLIVNLTVEDPLALEKPWPITLTYKRSRDSELIEFICAENDRNPVENGRTGFE
jgi:hypothetical protein